MDTTKLGPAHQAAALMKTADQIAQTEDGAKVLAHVAHVVRNNFHLALAGPAGELQVGLRGLPIREKELVLEFVDEILKAATPVLDAPRLPTSGDIGQLINRFNNQAMGFDKSNPATQNDPLRAFLIRFQGVYLLPDGIRLDPRIERRNTSMLESMSASVTVDTSNNTFDYKLPEPYKVKWGSFTTGSLDELVAKAGAKDVNNELAAYSSQVRTSKTVALTIETDNPNDPPIHLVAVPRSPGETTITMAMVCSKVSIAQLDPNTGAFIGGGVLEKPVVYFYPEQAQSIEVTVDVQGTFVAQYPKAQEGKNGWRFVATPDGTLRDPVKNRAFPYLFWEALPHQKPTIELSQAHLVARGDGEAFLEKVADAWALNDKERADFVSYWVARLERHPYCLVQLLSSDAYNQYAKMTVTPTPDTVNRLFMVIKGVAEPLPAGAPQLPTLTRRGFTVVEWGGAEV